MAAGNPAVTINVFAQTAQANQSLAQLGANINRVGSTANASGSALGGIAGGLGKMAAQVVALAGAYVSLRGAVAAVREMVNVNMTFEDSMAQARAVTEQNAGFTEEAFKKMQHEARRLGAITKFSAAEAAEGLKFLGMAGFTAEQATASLEGTLRLAQAGNIELGQSADIVSNIMTAYGASAEETGTYVDILAKTAATSNNSILELGDAMKYAAPISAGLGQGVHETAAAFAVLGNAGIKAGTAGAGLRMVMSQLTDSTSPTVKTLRAMGVEYDKVDPKANSLENVFKNLAAAGVNVEGVFAAFDARAANVAQVLVQNSGSLSTFTQRIIESGGAADIMSKTMDDTFKGAMLRARSAWQELLLSVGDSGAMGGLRSMVEQLAEALLSLSKGVKTLRAVFESGELGQLFLLSLQLGAMKAVNFLAGGLITAFKVAMAYLFGYFKMITSGEFWKNLWNIFKGAGLLLLGIAAQFQAAILEAIEPFAVNLTAITTMVVSKVKAGFVLVAATFIDLMLGGVQEIMEKLSAVSDIFGLDLDAAIEGVKGARSSAQGDANDAKDLLGKTFAEYKAEAAEKVGGAIDTLNSEGQAMVKEGLAAFSSGVGSQAGLAAELIGKPVMDAMSSFEPLDLFGDMQDNAQNALGQIWDAGAKRVADKEAALAKSEAGAVKKRDGEKDIAPMQQPMPKDSGLIASSLQQMGGGGRFFGAAPASMESLAERSARATEETARNTAQIATKDQKPTVSLDTTTNKTSAIATQSDSKGQLVALMGRAVELLGVIAAKIQSGGGGGKIGVSPA